MKLENTFEVPESPDVVWNFLLDVERVAPCMPGAELTEVVDDKTWKGKVTVKLGPVQLAYRGQVVMDERDDDSRRAVLSAKGTETRGKGTAQATITAQLVPTESGGTRAELETDLKLSGAAAQLARGMMGDVSAKLTGEFADCLVQRLAALSDGGEASTSDGDRGSEAATATEPSGSAKTPASQTSTATAPADEPAPIEGLALAGHAVAKAVRRNVDKLVAALGILVVVRAIRRRRRKRRTAAGGDDAD